MFLFLAFPCSYVTVVLNLYNQPVSHVSRALDAFMMITMQSLCFCRCYSFKFIELRYTFNLLIK